VNRIGQGIEFSFEVWTLPWTRHVPRRLELLGKQHGLQMTHEHDGGWLRRYHLITAHGEDKAVRRYHKVVYQWWQAVRGLPADPAIPEPLLQRLRNNTPKETPDAPVD
jgi:hypothetical protein